MRIDRIRVGAFGRLSDFDTGSAPLGGLVIVLGPNEAGKSTLFSFLTTALYGFQPATRDRNPHVPWGADEASGSIRVHLDGQGCAEVERKLRSQPGARLTVGGRATELRNQAVPWVDHVPRTVFRQVFAVTLGELAGLDGETWARIQDKVIGSMGAADLQSARLVAEGLEREAGEIWRPNRRGNQSLRDLQAEIRDLRGRRAAAQERDATIRRLVEERDAIRSELRGVREHRQLDRAEVERAQSLLPVKRRLERIDALRDEAGDRTAVEGLPSDPPARWTELQAELTGQQSACDDVEHAIGELETTLARAAEASPILGHRDEVVRLAARVAGCAPDRIRVLELGSELQELEARLDAAATTILRGSWRELAEGTLDDIPVELVAERAGRASPTVAADVATPESWLTSLVGASLLIWGLLTGPWVVAAIGAVTLLAALTLRLSRRSTGPPPAVAGDDLTTLLRGLPIRAERLEKPGESLVSELERLRRLARSRAELVRALAATEERVRAVDQAARGLALAIGRDADTDSEILARDLDRAVRDAERLQDGAASAAREIARLRLTRDAAVQKIESLRAELAALEERARVLAPGDVRLGLEAARARIRAQDRAARLEDELRHEHADVDQLRLRIDELEASEHRWSVDEEALARARARIEGHDERIESLVTRGEAIEGEVARLRDEETVDAVDSESASLRDEEARLVRLRDRKWVLATLLREADRRFREEHQPDLMRRAGSYLEHLTGGRYERLVVDEADADHLFHLVGPGLPAPVPLAPPVSTGTLEQAYLSLRLAMVDHLDQGGERLPLFVDEIFVNWDEERRTRGLEVLARIAETRQVFVFTCHPDLADHLSGQGAHVLELDQTG